MKKLLVILSLIASPAFAVCIPYSQMDSFTAYSSTQLRIKAYTGDYAVTVAPCWGLTTANQIGFDSFSSFQLCEHDYIVVTENGYNERCLIRKITE